MVDKSMKSTNLLEQHFTSLIEKEPDCISVNDTMGKILFSRESGSSAVEYLDCLMKSNGLSPWQQALLLQCISCCYYFNSDYGSSRKKITESINITAVSTEAITRAHYFENLFGFNHYYDNFEKRETEHFIFHIDPDAERALQKRESTVEEFIQLREEAFDKINSFFDAEFIRKIDYFVWASRDIAREKQSRPLGFAHPEYYLIHSVFNQSIGHEMTHIISHYIKGFTNAVPLICEGIAVYFDFTGQDKLREMKKAMKDRGISKLDFKELWLNWGAYPAIISYPASAVFVKYLLSNYGEEKFKRLLKNQTYENARNIYGLEIEKILSEVGDESQT